jgi:hypothetical protein
VNRRRFLLTSLTAGLAAPLVAAAQHRQGHNLRFEDRFADGHFERLPSLAAALVQMNVDVIVAVAPGAIGAARRRHQDGSDRHGAAVKDSTFLLAVAMLLGGACAAIQRYEARDTERMLAVAGFQLLPADTPERQEDLRSIPPHRMVSRTKAGDVVYMYADPDNCHCVYVGGSKEYSEYERLRAEREITQRAAGRAGGAP